ncbi:MAG: phosphoribosylformylglycinamidine synthase [Defluviitaleaceae bacterium]|nr:phosphoribosylformylglycinamidine synthase [Defluviitaleaceae bacterium]
MSVFSLYVEKKPEYAGETAAVLADLRGFVGTGSINGVRIVNRVFVEGISKATFDDIKNTILYDTATDIAYDAPPDFTGFRVFASELLPGQFDQEAALYAQSIALAIGTAPSEVRVRCTKIFAFAGDVSDKDFAAAKAWLINHVESRETTLTVPNTLLIEYADAEDVAVISGFTTFGTDELKALLKDLSLAMDLEDLLFCQAYFRDEEQRDPTMTEIKMIDCYWSDHCRHTTFLTHLESVEFEDTAIKESYDRYLALRAELGRQDKPVTLMDLATIGARVLKARGILTDVDESEEVNACSVKIKVNVDGKPQDWLLMFKNETHNHPTEIEPFGGASTCLGGAIRDPMSGRSYVYQAMRITGASDPRTEFSQTLPGKLAQRKICRTAAAGYSSYGNQIGAATGHIQEIYHPGYVAKRMELGALVGAAPAENVVRECPAAGDIVILLGGKTGRDGCSAAAGSSKSHTASSLETGGSEVQRGDAPEERKIVRLFRNPEATKLIKRCNDFGAGGVSVAIGELADGLDINLDKVPAKYGGLNGTELATSESQERMAIVIAAENVSKFTELAGAENLDVAIVATITDNSRMSMTWRGKTIVDLARSFLSSNGAAKRASAKICSPAIENSQYSELDRKAFTEFMNGLNMCSQKGLVDRFDSSVGAATMLAPLGGVHQLTPAQVMAARVPVLGAETTTCSLMAWGFDPFISAQSPYHGAAAAVVHSIAKLVAAGGTRKKCWLSFQEYFERLHNDQTRWGKPTAALLGALDAQVGLECGAIGGKDSMSGSFDNIDVPPTLVSFAVSVAEADNIISTEFKQAGSKVYFLNPNCGTFEQFDFAALRSFFDNIEKLIASGKVRSAWAVGSGGTAEAIAKMSFGNRIGFAASKPLTTEPVFGGFILEVDELQGFEDSLIGVTTNDAAITLSNGETIDLVHLQAAWSQTLEEVYPTSAEQSAAVSAISYESKAPLISSTKAASPKFVLPLVIGTNSEYDLERAIVKAGGCAESIVIRNNSKNNLESSIHAFEQAIRSAQCLVLPSGDISTSFIVSLLQHDAVRDAVSELLEKRDGLVYGVGAGFRALVKLGLLPGGEFARTASGRPYTVTNNVIGRHQATMVNVRIASNKSPWLSKFNVGDCAILPFSSEYGRFIADESLIKELAVNGQIATQFADLCGAPSMDVRFNPGGSAYAVEGLTSPDGRIFGRLCNSERTNSGLFVNIPGNKEIDVFAGAVNYFK